MHDESGNVNRTPSRASWTGSEVLLSILLAWLFWPAMVQTALQSIDFYRWFYGPELVAVAESKTGDANEKYKAQLRLSLWPSTLATPFQILTFPLIFAAFSGTRLAQLGLTTRRFGRNLLAGVAALLLLAPLVFGMWKLVHWCYGPGGEREIEKHGLEIIATLPLYSSEWVLIFFTAMLAAPLHEELTFRGVLQPWLATRRWGGHAAMLGALALAVLFRGERLLAAWPKGLASLTEAAAPALFVLGVLPIYLLVWWCSRTPSARAIFGVSLLFACIHTRVWPTPIPLFVLALGLGMLAQRTRSLVGPIVVHSLFNGVSCVELLLSRFVPH
jgi:membrane protease YdiL (CAAX protease family)